LPISFKSEGAGSAGMNKLTTAKQRTNKKSTSNSSSKEETNLINGMSVSKRNISDKVRLCINFNFNIYFVLDCLVGRIIIIK